MTPEAEAKNKGRAEPSKRPREGSGETQEANGGAISYGERQQLTSGAFAGKTVRFGMEIAQQPILGRKFGEKDRRPLAHSPICRIRIKDCYQAEGGFWTEEDIDVQQIESTAFICSVDLFTPPTGTSPTGKLTRSKFTHVFPTTKTRTDEERPEKRTKSHASRNLFGSLNVTAIRVAAPEGGMGMWFIFSDVCVRHEGSYSLRFRVFDLSALSSQPSGSVTESAAIRAPVAECFSNVFRVYSPRTFPGLPKTQTALSEHFSKQGFKLNVRKGAAKDEEEADEAKPDAGRPQPLPLQNHGSMPVVHGMSSGGSTFSTGTAGFTSEGSVRRTSITSSNGLINMTKPLTKGGRARVLSAALHTLL